MSALFGEQTRSVFVAACAVTAVVAGVLFVTSRSDNSIGLSSADLDESAEVVEAAEGTDSAAEGTDIGVLIEEQEQARAAAQLDTSMAEASLEALRENGALPSESSLEGGDPALGLVHYVSCLPDSCHLIAQWADGAGFEASAPMVTLGHGGAEELHIELRQTLAADATAMTASATTVADAVAALADPDTADLIYDGWAPELISDGGEL